MPPKGTVLTETGQLDGSRLGEGLLRGWGVVCVTLGVTLLTVGQIEGAEDKQEGAVYLKTRKG